MRTLVVSPTPEDPIAGGTSLMNTILGITEASASNRYLVKLEPGIYDIGANALTIGDFVDLEGSGERITTIRGSGTEVIWLADNAELRSFSVESWCDEQSAAAISTGITYPPLSADVASLQHVTIQMFGAASGRALSLNSVGAKMKHVTIHIETTGNFSTGIYAYNLQSEDILELSDIAIEVVGASPENDGIVFTGGSLESPPVTLELSDSSIVTTGDGAGISSFKDIYRITNVSIDAGNAVVDGVYGPGGSTIDRSTIQGRGWALYGNGLRVGSSRIGGLADNSMCAACYNADYQPLGADCL